MIPAQHSPNLLGPVNITVNRVIQRAIRHLVAFFQIDAHHVISPSMGDSISVSLFMSKFRAIFLLFCKILFNN